MSNQPIEPFTSYIQYLANNTAETIKEGPLTAMGVPRQQLPEWDDIQILPAQLATKPLEGEGEAGQTAPSVNTELVIGPESRRPLRLAIPLLVSDMSFGALSQEAKHALAMGCRMANAGMCTGEGGFSPPEKEALASSAPKTDYLFELGSGMFGFDESIYPHIRAFHFKTGQAAKTGIGGHLPGDKVTQEIVDARGPTKYKVGESIVSPATFANIRTVAEFRAFADDVRRSTDGIPIGFKISANHIEADLQFALDAGADYVIIDGRGGSTGAAPAIFRDHISVPTIPALARARRFLDQNGASGKVTLIVTGGLRTPVDFVKAMALGADGVALSNSALQAIGCIATRSCNKGNCPVGIATQDPSLRRRLVVEPAAQKLSNFFSSAVALMSELCRACGYDKLSDLTPRDLATWKYEIAQLSGIPFAGVAD